MAIVKGTLNSETLNAADGVTNGADDIFGFPGNDIIDGLGGDDTIYGGSGIDTLKGGGGEDNLHGGSENDKLFGQGDKDTLEGGDGDDLLDGGAGIDTMDGGDGNDTYIVDSFWDKVYEGRNGGNDTVKAGVSYDLAFADADYVETLRTTDDNGLAHTNLYGSNIANTLIGNAGVNILDGRANADVMSGLAGNDIYFVDKLGDIVFEAAGQGGDTVRAWSTYGLWNGQEVEALTTTDNNGALAINLSGNDFTQVIVGNAAVNVLRGFGGGDQLQGMAGNDTLIGGAGNDKFLFNTALNAATNVDTITDMTAGVDTIRLDDAHFAGIGPVGLLNADAFHIGATAADAEDRIVYNSATGQLFFDANGNAAGGSTLFANLISGLALSNTDFNVV